MYWYCLPSRIR